jgi:hypothetical protein
VTATLTGTLAGARAAVAGHVEDATGLPVLPYFAVADHIGEPTVMVGIASLVPGLTGCGQVLTMSVWVIAAQVDPGPADDELDAACDQVLAALTDLPTATVTAGERGVYAETNPAYRLTVEVQT